MKQFNISHEYNIDLWDEGVTDRKGADTSWIFASLNPIRQAVERKLNMKQKNFRLSTAYLIYYDILEKSAQYINAYAKGDRSVLLKDIDNSCDWSRFSYLVKKYGLAPLSAMPDEHCGHTGSALYVVNNRLKLGFAELDRGENTPEGIIANIKSILNDKLGEPPEEFVISYMNNKDEIINLEGLTPLGFYESIIDLTDYEEMPCSKALVVNQLKAGEQVVVLADTRHQSNAMLGILDTDFIDSTDLFGTDAVMTKEDKIKYGIIKPYEYLSIDGVQLENGIPVRFKAQATSGAEIGVDGHYTMSEKWFDEYVLKAVINKRYGV